MGEAWFISVERKMYHDLMTTPLSELPVNYLQKVLFEVASGKDFDSDTEAEEWNPWFRHLLPELVLRAHERHVFHLLEKIVTTFMVLFEQDLDSEYPEFPRDAIDTLAVALMNPGFWPLPEGVVDTPENRVPQFLLHEHSGQLDVERMGFGQASKVFSAAMCFCLKYLAPGDIASWVDSIFAIDHLHWRLAFFTWLLGARRLLAERTGKSIEETVPEIRWDGFFRLRGTELLIAREHAQAFSDRVLSHLSHEAVDAWTEEFRADRRIEQVSGLNWLMSRIHSLSFRDGRHA
jgi:hypothetical protein